LKKILILVIILMCTASLEAVQNSKIRITSHQDNAKVDRPAKIEGTVTNPNAKVYIIVHPVDVPEYWVQPRASVNQDGKWTSMVYLGRSTDNNPDKQYELMAIAGPEKSMKAGSVLKEWPGSKWRSQIIHVKRRAAINSNYYIQVGTWSKLHYANAMILKLKKHYPQAYLISGNNLNKIIIPDIETKLHGEKIIKDIENKFELKPILKLKKQQSK
jgi:hypothetical protein